MRKTKLYLICIMVYSIGFINGYNFIESIILQIYRYVLGIVVFSIGFWGNEIIEYLKKN